MINEVPETGDIIRLYTGPAKGTEQDGYRAFLVLTDNELNELTGRVSGVPITTTVRGWETEVPIASLERPGVALSDQITTLDFRARGFKFRRERATGEELDAIRYAVRSYLGL
ncbi:type II toxin-antitoxin system PemK/MazF family toxin [Paraburkholderia phosphatilytica]|uniref:type II toxin-antitoxin system PemK/MazF family toxin n=1 Tax=Paraburkholderia phosphatilytica TaxID=2282883 RepID=UPI000E471305|nr:type II toxin-antitoxin system PemK/MazF family toxin [Paraburkholderia phosphatilytica]